MNRSRLINLLITIFFTTTVSVVSITTQAEESSAAASGDTDSSEQRAETAINDATITAKIKLGLLNNQVPDADNIAVDTRQGVVTLQGKVRDDKEKRLVEDIANRVKEVERIENELRVSAR